MGSGGPYALAAARALVQPRRTSTPRRVAREAMKIAAGICIYTNEHVTVETL